MSNVSYEYNLSLSSECYKNAKLMLGETDELRQQSIIEIINWLNENPTINGNRDVINILYFLRCSKYKLDKAKRKIKK